MDYLWSFLFNVNVNDEQQRIFVLNICSKILSHTSQQTDSSLNIGHHYFERHYAIDKLLREVFRSNHVNVTRTQMGYYTVDYDDYTMSNVLWICKEWSKPLIQGLKRLNKEKRREWKQTYDGYRYKGYRSEDMLKNELIDQIY